MENKMKTVLCALWILTVTFATGQVKSKEALKENVITIDQLKTEPVITGFSFKYPSKILHQERIISVGLPDGYERSTKRYPVFYVVDGQWTFNGTLQAINALSNNGVIPQMILITINTADQRDRDLLPTRDEQTKMGGDADTLLRFIKEELFPFVEKNYRTYPYRLLAGSSFGGVFVMHAFLTDSNLFNSYLTLSPSMWWDYRVMLKRTESFLSKKPKLHNYLYVAVANEGTGMGVEALANILKRDAPKELIWKFDEYPEEIHNTVFYKGVYNGLKFAFADWTSQPINFDTKGDMISSKDTVIVKINSFSKIVRYTLDGSEPTANSPLYEKPFLITKALVLKATPFYGDGIPGNCDSLAINYIPTLSAETDLPVLKNGLSYSYYEGDWSKLPDFTKLIPTKSGNTNNFMIEERKMDDLFAMRYAGFINIPKDNIYSFYLTSDDGSRLAIGDKVLVDNDGLHGVVEKKGKIYLKKGQHRLEVLFFQKGGGYSLNLEYESPGIPKQSIPASSFFYSGN
jgi:predicted alpha/beta superfamily hydrolase